MANILVCDDERSICELLDIALRKEGHRVETVNSGEGAKRKLDSALYDLVLTDVKMPNVGGIEVLKHSRSVSPETAVVLITAVEDVHAAIQAVKEGAADYIQKGPDLLEAVRVAIQKALDKQNLRRQNFALRRDAGSRNSLDNLIGSSTAIRKLKETIRTVASTGSTIVIHGESGTGKELVARAIHACSPRAAEPFVSVNCGAFPETLLESELFGYVKGAFTGASQNKRGLFEVAHGGTIFLDEISEMTLAMQVKLLRVLQERVLRPVGGTDEIAIDVRVIAATNKDLSRMVTEGAFREDLYYRVSVIPIEVPPLRERADDVPVLAGHFLKKYAPAAGKSIVRIVPESLSDLCGYDWPGNVRQLENTIERAVALEMANELHVELPLERHRVRVAAANGNGQTNGNGSSGENGNGSGHRPPAADHSSGNGQPANGNGLPTPPQHLPYEGVDLERYIASMERALIQSALRQSNGVQTRAAEMLKLSYRSFRHLVKKYDI